MTGTQNIDIRAVPEVYIDCKSHVEKKVFTFSSNNLNLYISI